MPVIISEAENKEYDVVTPTLNINQEKTCKSNNTMSSKTDSFDGKINDAGNNNKPLNEYNNNKASERANKDTKEKACGLNGRETPIENPLNDSMEEKDVDGDCSETVEGDSIDEIHNVVKEFSDLNEHKNVNRDESSDEYENVDECSNEHENFNAECSDEDNSNDSEYSDEHENADEESSYIQDNKDEECSEDHAIVIGGCSNQDEGNEAAGKYLLG